MPQSFKDPKGCPDTDTSFENGEIVWFTFHAPEDVSLTAAITVGVYVDETFWFVESVTWYVTGVAVPVQSVVGVNETIPVEVLTE